MSGVVGTRTRDGSRRSVCWAVASVAARSTALGLGRGIAQLAAATACSAHCSHCSLRASSQGRLSSQFKRCRVKFENSIDGNAAPSCELRFLGSRERLVVFQLLASCYTLACPEKRGKTTDAVEGRWQSDSAPGESFHGVQYTGRVFSSVLGSLPFLRQLATPEAMYVLR